MYFLVEGYGGCGKTKITEYLTEYLTQKGKVVVKTREPGSPLLEVNMKLRDILLNDPVVKDSPRAQLHLFLADRKLHMDNVVIPSIKDNYSVVQDRGYISSIVYQGIEGKIGQYRVDKRHLELNLYEPYPDKVILVDTDPLIAMERLDRRDGTNKHNFNKCDIEKAKRRREHYLNTVEIFVPKKNLLILNNDRDFSIVSKILNAHLEKLEI